MLKIKRIYPFVIWLFVICILIYSRFVNLSWGLPYPMHPDERNMAVGVQQLSCPISNFKFQISNCFNPHFFAYGQFPLYLAYAGTMWLKFFDGDLGTPISFEEAALSLRLTSAIASVLNVFVLLRIVSVMLNSFLHLNSKDQIPKQVRDDKLHLISLLIIIFSPFFIQFSHFGTTESLLMLLYSSIVYVSLLFLNNKILNSRFLILTSFLCGLAIATKVSSVLFLIVPIITLTRSSLRANFYSMVKLVILSLVVSIIFAPHNFISFQEFLGSIKYESDVATGAYRAFYTKQFEGTLPILFQLEKIFPYALGWPVFILSLLGFLFLPYKKEYNLLRFAIIANLLPNSFLYAKWTRFVSPILPLLLLFAILMLMQVYGWLKLKIKDQRSKIKLISQKILNFTLDFALCTLFFALILPGLAYLTIYQSPDVRFRASEWIYKNIPNGSYILSETANVVDPPIQTKNNQQSTIDYQYISFDFYHLDENPDLKSQLDFHLSRADYIFIPSRRLFANHYCSKNIQYPMSNQFSIFNIQYLNRNYKCDFLRKTYPLLNDYYDRLFSAELGFGKVAEFASFPKIEFFGKTLLEFPDEEAEETWTVFDHPVIRIYKRI